MTVLVPANSRPTLPTTLSNLLPNAWGPNANTEQLMHWTSGMHFCEQLQKQTAKDSIRDDAYRSRKRPTRQQLLLKQHFVVHPSEPGVSSFFDELIIAHTVWFAATWSRISAHPLTCVMSGDSKFVTWSMRSIDSRYKYKCILVTEKSDPGDIHLD